MQRVNPILSEYSQQHVSDSILEPHAEIVSHMGRHMGYIVRNPILLLANNAAIEADVSTKVARSCCFFAHNCEILMIMLHAKNKTLINPGS